MKRPSCKILKKHDAFLKNTFSTSGWILNRKCWSVKPNNASVLIHLQISLKEGKAHEVIVKNTDLSLFFSNELNQNPWAVNWCFEGMWESFWLTQVTYPGQEQIPKDYTAGCRQEPLAGEKGRTSPDSPWEQPHNLHTDVRVTPDHSDVLSRPSENSTGHVLWMATATFLCRTFDPACRMMDVPLWYVATDTFCVCLSVHTPHACVAQLLFKSSYACCRISMGWEVHVFIYLVNATEKNLTIL